jgi:hypothetical protein
MGNQDPSLIVFVCERAKNKNCGLPKCTHKMENCTYGLIAVKIYCLDFLTFPNYVQGTFKANTKINSLGFVLVQKAPGLIAASFKPFFA